MTHGPAVDLSDLFLLEVLNMTRDECDVAVLIDGHSECVPVQLLADPSGFLVGASQGTPDKTSDRE